MGEVLNISNVYQLLAFLIVVGFQVYMQRGVGKLANGQSRLQDEIEGTRVEMFRLAQLSGMPIIRTEGHVAGVAATIEAALKVAYLQGKADAKSGVEYPQARIAVAAKKLAEVALREPTGVPTASGDAPPIPAAGPQP